MSGGRMAGFVHGARAVLGAKEAGKDRPVPSNGDGLVAIDDLWQPKGAPRHRQARGPTTEQVLVSGTGVVLDGTVVHRAKVEAGQVVSYEAFSAASPADALSQALSGTKGAQVVVTDGGVLFAPSVPLMGDVDLGPAVLAELAGRTWPASSLAAVAGLAGARRSVALAGWEEPAAPWAQLRKARARLVALPFVFPAGAWLAVGQRSSWFVVVEGNRPVVCRELKAGLGDVQQVAALASAEVARLAKAGQAPDEVRVLGLRLSPTVTADLARVGVRATGPAIGGVTRWGVPWADQGPAGLAVLVALARPPASAVWLSPEELAHIAEAPARRRRLVLIGAGGALALGVAMTGLVPMLSARSTLSAARTSLHQAQVNEASVSHWLVLRDQVQQLSAEAARARQPDGVYVPALTELVATAPVGTQVTMVDAQARGAVTLTVTAQVPGQSFLAVAAWQRRLEARGAQATVSGESVDKGQVSLNMTVVVPPKPQPRARFVPKAQARNGRR